MTKVLARAAMDSGHDVIGAETHGMAQRGGSVVSHLRLGTGRSSLVGTGEARYLLALNADEAYRCLPFLAPEGRLYTNADADVFPSAPVADYLRRNRMVSRCLPVGRIALEQGAPMSANLALLGFFAALDDGPLSEAVLRTTVDQVTPERFKAINLKVFDACAAAGRTLYEPDH